MSEVGITIACQGYDRVRALQSGEVRVEGCSTQFFPMRAEETFHRAFNGAQFDVTELSMSTHLLMAARGIGSPYVAIPVFPSRMFRHSAIYIRTDRGIEQPGRRQHHLKRPATPIRKAMPMAAAQREI